MIKILISLIMAAGMAFGIYDNPDLYHNNLSEINIEKNILGLSDYEFYIYKCTSFGEFPLASEEDELIFEFGGSSCSAGESACTCPDCCETIDGIDCRCINCDSSSRIGRIIDRIRDKL